MSKDKELLTEFLTDLKQQIGTYRLRDIDIDLCVNVFLNKKECKLETLQNYNDNLVAENDNLKSKIVILECELQQLINNK